ncbi:type 4b pilus protein PilO2 [Asaia krungthepensis]|uniref:Pilin accessory protein (PilO) n=1 Tax=Asaia krungthepensis NRIC 0535 TaxID=1307925 RepID=A0ABQ0Q4P0_9PROT|nr:type 4b pilus protein PilO2 [Asaia krungthepensis]GBQ91204.1 hypothetical protein AA0535_2238 [Asaia krungthepensis NRIC 0535]
MSLIFRANDTEWVVGATWMTTRNQPGASALRQRARASRATHYVVMKSTPLALGFFDLAAMLTSESGKRLAFKRGNPLAPLMARALGADVFAQISLPDGSIWVIATDHDAMLLPGTDRIVASGDIDAFVERFEMGRFSERRLIDGHGLDTILATLKPETVKFHEVSLQAQWKPAIAAGAALLLAYEGHHLWRAHIERLRDEQAQREAAARQNIIAETALRNAPIPPSEWVEGCMDGVLHQPVFHEGWIQTSWQCADKTLTLEWLRSGGTLADAPVGAMSANGDRISQTVPLIFHRPAMRRHTKGDGTKQLVSWLQTLGIRPKVTLSQIKTAGMPVPGQPASIATGVSWVFPTDPRNAFWDDVSGLSIQSLSHLTGAAPAGGVVMTGAGYRMEASVAAPVLEMPR